VVLNVCTYISDVVFAKKELSKDEILKELTHRATELGFIEDEAAFLEELKEREKLMSTGIGLGVAIPHVKSDVVKSPFIILGIYQNPVKSWDSIDDKPINFVFYRRTVSWSNTFDSSVNHRGSIKTLF
jgi:PTS system nitrogen regulatory IIA component